MKRLLLLLQLHYLIMKDRLQDKLERFFIIMQNRLNNLVTNLRLFISLNGNQPLFSRNHQLPHLIQTNSPLQAEIVCLVYRPQVKLSMIGVGLFLQLKTRV